MNSAVARGGRATEVASVSESGQEGSPGLGRRRRPRKNQSAQQNTMKTREKVPEFPNW